MPRRAPRRLHDLAALRDFARGYLHEDVLAEHGSSRDAAAAFARDASDDERRRVLDALERVSDAWPAAKLARLFTDTLGAAWTPASRDEVRALIEAIRAARG